MKYIIEIPYEITSCQNCPCKHFEKFSVVCHLSKDGERHYGSCPLTEYNPLVKENFINLESIDWEEKRKVCEKNFPKCEECNFFNICDELAREHMDVLRDNTEGEINDKL